MSTPVGLGGTQESSPRPRARIAGGVSLLTMLMGIVSMSLPGKLGTAAYFCATASNVAAALLFYRLFRPVNKIASLAATIMSFLVSVAGVLEWHPQGVDIGLVFLGLYCLLIGGLVWWSRFLPRILGLLMAVAGLCWMSSLYSAMTHLLSPYNLAGGALGQGALTLWLLVMGVDTRVWKELSDQAPRVVNNSTS